MGYLFSSWRKRWSRIFLIGFLGVIVTMTLLDQLFVEFEYIRMVDLLIIVGYDLFVSLEGRSIRFLTGYGMPIVFGDYLILRPASPYHQCVGFPRTSPSGLV